MIMMIAAVAILLTSCSAKSADPANSTTTGTAQEIECPLRSESGVGVLYHYL